MKKTSHLPVIAMSLLLPSLSLNLWSQSVKTYQFIEPNVAIMFDSNLYKFRNGHSNLSYEVESIDFIKTDDTAHRVVINIAASLSDLKPTRELQRNLMEPKRKLKDLIDDQADVESTEQKTIEGFSCVAIIVKDKANNKYGTLIKGLKLFDGGYCEVSYVSFGRNDLQKEYKVLGPFLSGFVSYTQKQIMEQDFLIKNKYTVVVDTLASRADIFTNKPVTFHGIVRVKQHLEDRVAEVRLAVEMGENVFYPDEKGEIEIIASDKVVGKITKQGELIIFNSFGKKVHLPFSFTYTSRGIN